MGEITTDANGRATISLNAGEYYLRNNSVQLLCY
ncbi:MAG: prealbumin-like fold domain-containing protein [Defluviitaleaceae bacterium]|nr:prealbumin-like fold domain-containing protein [Defluviitaleaceae bacterium]